MSAFIPPAIADVAAPRRSSSRTLAPAPLPAPLPTTTPLPPTTAPLAIVLFDAASSAANPSSEIRFAPIS